MVTITGSDPGSATVASATMFASSGSKTTTETTVQPAQLSASTDRDAAQQGLGKPLPIVIGTGRVDGVYFIGGVETVTTVTTTTTTTPSSGYYVVVGSNPNAASEAASQQSRFSTTETSSTSETETQTFAGYVLAYDMFERGYDLIRVEIDGDVVFDSENGIAATQTLRFYGGRHDAADPILSETIGANVGAYHNFVMLFLDGYPSDAPPSVSCVISNGATDQPESQRIEWTGAVPTTFGDPFAYGSSYDPADGIIYHLLEEDDVPGAGAYQLAVLDTDTHLERYRVPLADSGGYFGSNGRPQIMALRGTAHILAEFHMGSPNPPDGRNRIYDAVTGAIVAEHVDTSTQEMRWVAGLPFGQKYVFMGFNRHAGEGQQIHFGVADIAAGTFDIVAGSIGYNGPPAWGRQVSGSVSFYSTRYGADTEVHEHTFNGDTWTSALVYAAGDPVQGLHFDPDTGYLVVASVVASVDGHVDYINPDSGAVIAAFDPGVVLSNNQPIAGFERFWARPGFALFWTSTSVISLLNIRDKTVSVFTDNGSVANNWTGVIFDQNKLAYYSYYGDSWWTEYRLPNIAPRLLDLDDVVTDVMYLAGFGLPDLTFSGFSGLQTWGFVIASDSTIQSVVRAIADIYDFSWCDTGSGFYFKKAGQGELLSIDVALTGSDIVERPQPVQTSDEANIRTPSGVEMEYVSKEGIYKSRPTSFSMTTGVLNSITAPKFSTPILMNDAEAQRIVTEKFFAYQENRRGHGLVVAPEHIVTLPGDIVSFPSGLVAYTAQVEQVAVDLRNMGIEISARDFQTEVETTITSVSNNLVTVLVYYASQYLHLDMPLFRYSDDTGGASLVQYGVVAPRGQAAWSGGVLYRGPAPSALAAITSQAPHAGVVGVCTTVLNPPLDPFALDDASTVTIRRVTADTTLLADASEDEVLAGKNNALIGIDGRWEWVGFKTVVDNFDGTYTLSGFALRGYRGSEVFCARHEVNDVFIMLDAGWLKKAGHPVSDLGDALYYLAAGIGQNPNAAAAKPHIITGAAETPYACVNLEAEVAIPDGIDLAWDYRSRVAAGLNPANFGEETLAFEIDIYDGATYKRTLTAATNAKHYATADVVADFGADPPNDISFRVYMMSALPIFVPGQERPVAGRGYEARRYVNIAGTDVDVAGQSAAVSVGAVTVTAVAGPIGVTGQSMTVSVGSVAVLTNASGTIVLVDQRTDPASGSLTKTMTSVNFGTENSTRIIAVMVTGAGLSHEISAVTIGGVAATLGAKTTNDRSSAIYFRAVPTGASGTVDVTVTDTATIYTTVVALYGVAPTVFDSDTLVIGGFATSFNKSIDASDGGIVLGAFGDTDKNVAVTWTNLDELNDLYPGGANQRHSTAYKVVTSAATISVTAATPSNVGGALSLVSFAGIGGTTVNVAGQSVTASVGAATVTAGGGVTANVTGQSIAASVGAATFSGGATWQTNATAAVSTGNAGWNGYTMRVRVAAAGLANGGGTKVRVTLKAASSGSGFTIDGCYIGAGAASGDVYDFETTPTQLTFSGGSAGAAVAINATVRSDEVTYSIDASKPLLISLHYSATSSVATLATKANWTTYYKTAVSEAATVNVTGYSTAANAAYVVSLIESLV